MATADPIPLPPLTKVAIIGAGGPSGISALTQLLDKGVRPDQIRAYEARSSAGGVWHYEEDAGIAQTEWRGDGRPVLRTEAERLDPGRNGPTGECGDGACCSGVWVLTVWASVDSTAWRATVRTRGQCRSSNGRLD